VGADPADLARTDPEALRRAVADARPFLLFRVERVLDSADLRTNEGRAKAAEAALAVVADHPNGLVRDQYLMVVADRCRLEAASLRGLLDDLVRRGPDATPPRPSASRGGAARPETPRGRPDDGEAGGGDRPRSRPLPGPDGDAQRAGLEALRLVVHDPAAVADRLEALLFSDGRQRAAFVFLSTAGDLHGALSLAEEDSPDVAVLLRRLAVEEPAADADDVVVQLVWIASRRALADLESQVRLAPEALITLAPVIAQATRDVQELEVRDGAIVAAKRLLAWLVERGEENS
jgi:DNA primase